MSEWYPSTYWSHWRTASGAQVLQKQDHPRKFNLLSFLALAQALNLEFLPFVYDMGADAVGFGGTSRTQETMIDLNLSYAFKIYQKRGVGEEEVFSSLINELTVSSQPVVRDHPNIIQLRGISWNISAVDDKPWPVLVYEKSHWGDLYHFARHEGKDMTMRQRLEICVDIGNAIMDMYSNHIVHGDIKPENVLIFKDTPQRFRAKVIDFGYSSHYMDNEQQLTLARSEPWNAPENDGHQREWLYLQAVKSDLFCFGMLCFWLLFEPRISKGEICRLDQESPPIEVITSMEHRLLMMKKDLKSHARSFISSNTGLTKNENMVLFKFFVSSLSHDPDERQTSLSTFLEGLDVDKKDGILQEGPTLREKGNSFPRGTILTGTKSNMLSTEFKIQLSIFDLYGTDYRVRAYIAQSLLSNAAHSPAMAVQAALCYYIGFGVTRDEAECKKILEQSNQEIQSVEDTIDTLRQQYKDLPDTSLARRRSAGHFPRSDLILLCAFQGKLEQSEQHLSHEARDLFAIFGNDHVLTTLAKDKLAELLFARGKFEDAANLFTETLETRQIMFGSDHISTLEAMVNLAIVHYPLSLLEEPGGPFQKKAEDMLQKAITSFRIKLGPYHETTLLAMSNLALLLQKSSRSESEKLDVQVMEGRMASLDVGHPSRLGHLGVILRFYMKKKQWNKAEETAITLLDATRQNLGPDHFMTATRTYDLFCIYMAQDRWAEAELLGEPLLLNARKAGHGPDEGNTWAIMARLGIVFAAQGRLEDAEALLKPVRETWLKKVKTTVAGKDGLVDVVEIYVEAKRVNPRFSGQENKRTPVTNMLQALEFYGGK